VLLIFGAVLGVTGLFTVQPNEAKALLLFGDYRGTVHEPGLRWANPFYSKRKVSIRTRNFETGKLKVNDSRSRSAPSSSGESTTPRRRSSTSTTIATS